MASPIKPRTYNDYTVGWICALPKEHRAAVAMLDEVHTSPLSPFNEPGVCTLGSIDKYNVVIVCLPQGLVGTTSASVFATWMICSGMPPKVRLGDVVFGTPVGNFPGIVQWNSGRVEQDDFERALSQINPPSLLLVALSKVEGLFELEGPGILEYLERPKQGSPGLDSKYFKSDSLKDLLFKAEYNHITRNIADPDLAFDDDGEEEDNCRFCDKTMVIAKKPREMRLHYGLIASSHQEINSAVSRNRLKQEFGRDLLCIEMEAVGLANYFPCLAIRGICDYADSHKNNDWQEHAALVAAVYAKKLLQNVNSRDVDEASSIMDRLRQGK
ncbi:hypothetical protein ACSS6W_008337 [Trichoderma asperelloides]